MSIRSTPHPLSQNVSRKNEIKNTHSYHSQIVNQKAINNLAVTPNTDLLGGTYLDDRKLCSIHPDKFGTISGCSAHHNDIFNNPQPDFVQKISDDSFSSQFFNSTYGVGNNEVVSVKKEEIKSRRNKLPYTIVPGLELKKGLQLNRIDGLPSELDERDLYESYCHKKYRNKLFPTKK